MSVPYVYHSRLDKPNPKESTEGESINKIGQPVNILAIDVLKNEPRGLKLNKVFNTEQRIAKAFTKFDNWIKMDDHNGEKDPSRLLLRWLYCDQGAKLILKYEEFVELANRLNRAGYDIPQAPSTFEFDKAWQSCQESLKGAEGVFLLLASSIKEKQ